MRDVDRRGATVEDELGETEARGRRALEADAREAARDVVTVELASIESADGLLVRAYSREQLSAAEAAYRDTALDRRRKDELAQAAWEIGWDELTRPEREALLGVRWHRLGKLRNGDRDLRSVAVAVSPTGAKDKAPAPDVLLGRLFQLVLISDHVSVVL